MSMLNRRQALGGIAVTVNFLASGAFADATLANRKLVASSGAAASMACRSRRRSAIPITPACADRSPSPP